jgi:hypothetical protein
MKHISNPQPTQFYSKNNFFFWISLQAPSEVESRVFPDYPALTGLIKTINVLIIAIIPILVAVNIYFTTIMTNIFAVTKFIKLPNY